jgi:hypothetical protein
MLISRSHCLHSIDHPGQKGSILAKLQLFAVDTDIDWSSILHTVAMGAGKEARKTDEPWAAGRLVTKVAAMNRLHLC